MTKLPDAVFDRLLRTMLKGTPSKLKAALKPLAAA
jgi:hypothetical protein